MFMLIGKWMASLGLALSSAILALNPLATTTPSTVNNTPVTPEEIAQSLHDKITDLRAEVERAHLESSIALPLLPGSHGENVTNLQNVLVTTGSLSADNATGYYGTATQNAVRQFQKSFMLPVTGIVDTNTLGKIVEVAVDRQNLDAIYFPEESQLLNMATSSEAFLQTVEYSTPSDGLDGTDTSTPAPSEPTPQTIAVTITGNNYAFSPNTLSAHPGDVIVVHYTVTSGTHNFVIDGFNIKTANVSSGHSIDFNFPVTQTGTFTFYSSVSNDKAQGMIGTLTVQPAQ